MGTPRITVDQPLTGFDEYGTYYDELGNAHPQPPFSFGRRPAVPLNSRIDLQHPNFAPGAPPVYRGMQPGEIVGYQQQPTLPMVTYNPPAYQGGSDMDQWRSRIRDFLSQKIPDKSLSAFFGE